jgi:hypothetical protein
MIARDLQGEKIIEKIEAKSFVFKENHIIRRKQSQGSNFECKELLETKVERSFAVVSTNVLVKNCKITNLYVHKVIKKLNYYPCESNSNTKKSTSERIKPTMCTESNVLHEVSKPSLIVRR